MRGANRLKFTFSGPVLRFNSPSGRSYGNRRPSIDSHLLEKPDSTIKILFIMAHGDYIASHGNFMGKEKVNALNRFCTAPGDSCNSIVGCRSIRIQRSRNIYTVLGEEAGTGFGDECTVGHYFDEIKSPCFCITNE